jgi:hypothetical protein
MGFSDPKDSYKLTVSVSIVTANTFYLSTASAAVFLQVIAEVVPQVLYFLRAYSPVYSFVLALYKNLITLSARVFICWLSGTARLGATAVFRCN